MRRGGGGGGVLYVNTIFPSDFQMSSMMGGLYPDAANTSIGFCSMDRGAQLMLTGGNGCGSRPSTVKSKKLDEVFKSKKLVMPAKKDCLPLLMDCLNNSSSSWCFHLHLDLIAGRLNKRLPQHSLHRWRCSLVFIDHRGRRNYV